MDTKDLVQALPAGTFNKETIYQTALENNSQLKLSSVYWLINKLIGQGLLIRVGRNKYCVTAANSKRKVYHYQFSAALQKIVDDVAEHFPLIQFQAWEAIQFNRFANHQIAQNLFFIEVESMLESAVYEFLREETKHQVLLKPTMEICEVYAGSDTIIVQNLITETPVDQQAPHHVMLEKLLVDLFADEKLQLFLETSEFSTILEQAFHTYVIDESKMFRYARRRNIEDKIKRIIVEDTTIKLHV